MFAEINKEAFKYLPFVLNTVGESPRQRPINHPKGIFCHEFIWVTRGIGHFCVNGEHFNLEKEQGVFIKSSVSHSYDGDDFDTAWFTFTLNEGLFDFLSVPEFFRFDVPSSLTSENRLLGKFANGDSNVISRSSAGYAHTIELLSAILHPSESPETTILRFLESHYAESLTLDMIANEVGMNRYSVCRYYMKKRGISIMDELNSIRIAKAKRFLRYTSEPIEKIGRMCGFESPSYFAKRFREASGKSPGQYREK